MTTTTPHTRRSAHGRLELVDIKRPHRWARFFNSAEAIANATRYVYWRQATGEFVELNQNGRVTAAYPG